MDSGTFQGLLTLALLLMFVGIWIWAWSGRRKKGFEKAAQLPLEDAPTPKTGANGDNRKHTERENDQ